MEKLISKQILDARLDDSRKLDQALHAPFLTGDFISGLKFVTAVTEAAEEAAQPRRLPGHPARYRPPPADQRHHPCSPSHDALMGDDVIDPSGRVPFPSFVILADPEGNKACVCTCLNR